MSEQKNIPPGSHGAGGGVTKKGISQMSGKKVTQKEYVTIGLRKRGNQGWTEGGLPACTCLECDIEANILGK